MSCSTNPSTTGGNFCASQFLRSNSCIFTFSAGFKLVRNSSRKTQYPPFFSTRGKRRFSVSAWDGDSTAAFAFTSRSPEARTPSMWDVFTFGASGATNLAPKNCLLLTLHSCDCSIAPCIAKNVCSNSPDTICNQKVSPSPAKCTRVQLNSVKVHRYPKPSKQV
jgi:hypothetical protein